MNDPSIPNVIRADFLTEARSPEAVPAEGPAEVAIAGRSNVGKSTLLNRLAARRSLARTSKTPGRTRGIMFYDLGVRWAEGTKEGVDALRLVDLPGYGYAQVSHAERKSWQALIEGYVKKRTTLAMFFVLQDARRELGDEERQLVEWLGTLGVRHQMVITKSDKISAAERGRVVDGIRKQLGPRSAPALVVSGQTGDGVPRLWGAIRAACAPRSAAPASGTPAEG